MSTSQSAPPMRYTPERIDRIVALARSGLAYVDDLVAVIVQLRGDLKDEEEAHEDARRECDFLAGELKHGEANPTLCARCDRDVKTDNPARSVVAEDAA